MTASSSESEGIDACRSLPELLQGLAVPCLLLDDAGTVILRNPAAEALSQALWPASAPENWAELRASIPEFPETRPIPTAGGHLGHRLVASRIDSKTKGAAHYLLQCPIDEADRAMQLAAAVHDVRTDLQTIIAASELSAQDAADQGLQSSITAAAEHALKLINAALDLARLEFLQDSPARDPLRVATVVRQTAERLMPLAQKNGLIFRIELPAETRRVEALAQPIITITQNLLSNAFKFTRAGEVCLSLTETPAGAAGWCDYCLTVEDTGDGFHGAEREALLAPFRTGANRPSNQPGTGIGTYLIQKAVTALNGRLETTAPARGGTRIAALFTLPLVEEEASAPEAEPPAEASDTSLAGMRILILEDNATNLKLFLRTLSQAGAVAEGVTDGRQALAKLTADGATYDLVLLDLTMEGMDGIALATTLLLSDRPGAGLRLAALTGHDDDATRAACRVLGMGHTLEKPIRPRELCRKVAELTALPLPPSPLPTAALNQDLVSELIEDMGQQIAVSLLQRALKEARDLFDDLVRKGVTAEGRNGIHSALGSSGLTGLARVEFALRVVQAVSRIRENGSPAMTAALDLLQRALRETQRRLSDWPPPPGR